MQIIKNITKIITNWIKTSKITSQCKQGRLIPLNKDPSNIPNINNIRPINISSPLLKIFD